jgi:hypothetical protein
MKAKWVLRITECKNMGLLTACAAALIAGAGGINSMISNKSNNHLVGTYHITESTPYTSLDPLDGDKTVNLPVQRMIYLTPLEVGPEDELVSQILSDFYFDNTKNQIVFKVKKGLEYSDGTEIDPMDIVVAIMRMLKRRPDFPVIRSIEGKLEWLKKGGSLNKVPSGIQVDRDQIRIQLMTKEFNPLYRFCLELFSITPRKCYNPTTHESNCEHIPVSGFYEIKGESQGVVTFKKRNKGKIYGKSAPQTVVFKYGQIDLVKQPIDYSDVIATNEAKLQPNELKELEKKYLVSKSPSSRFSNVLINKKSKIFSDIGFRRWFVERFRRAYSEVNGNEDIQSSIFTKLLPGYLTHDELLSSVGEMAQPNPDQISTLQNLVWFENPSTSPNLLRGPLEKVFFDLGLKLPEPLRTSDFKVIEKKFGSGEIDFMYGSSGFWALDPVGDIQMLFTPHMHELLEGVWSDPETLRLLKELSDSRSDNIDEKLMAVNKKLFSDSYFNVFGHHSRLFLMSKEREEKVLPMGVTSPPPWLVFSENE